jgi:ABC-type nickel/cobalt efflux system permease component RcnA
MSAERKCGTMILAVLAVISLMATPDLSSGHPLGNFSISHYAAIRLEPDALALRYVVDMAEIPTFQEIQDTQIVPEASHPSLAAYLSQRVESLRAGLLLELNGRPLPLSVDTSEVIFPPGAGGLPTLKLGIRFHATIEAITTATAYELRYRDANFPGRAGWKEIIASASQGMLLLRSTVPERDRSRELADYPTDLLHSPPQEVEARIIFARQAPIPEVAAVGTPPSSISGTRKSQTSTPTPTLPHQGGENIPSDEVWALVQPARLEANRQMTPRSSFTELVSAPQLGFGIVLVALVAAVGLGAFHALEPGHGKTVVAAYLIGSRGTAWHALMLGLIVTVTHTAGVYILGAITLLASRYVVPERLYPWLGVASGLIIVGLGLRLFLRRYAGANQAHSHAHAHSHAEAHSHAYAHTQGYEEHHSHVHGHHAPAAPAHPQHTPATVSCRELLALGITGGMIPCPAALVVLLSALSLNRVGFGLLLIVAFSLGLAAVLIAIGILMVYAHRLMTKLQGDGLLMTRWLPLTSATVMTLFGLAIAVQALMTAGILQIRL